VLNFQVKPVIDPSNTLAKYEYATMLKVQSQVMTGPFFLYPPLHRASRMSFAQGVQVCAGPDFMEERFFWCYTDIHRYDTPRTLVRHSLTTTLLAQLVGRDA
jgi:hypothetical protein